MRQILPITTAFLCILAAVGCGADDSNGSDAATGGAGGAGAEAGTGGIAGSGGSGGSGGAAVGDLPRPVIPQPVEACPTLATGTVMLLGQEVQLWVGERREDVEAPVLFYWHGLGSVSAEAGVFMQPQIDEVVAEGGMVASFTNSVGRTTDAVDVTGAIWHSSDFDMTDTLLACAVEQLNIDTRRIYSAGCSAGGLQTGAMTYFRSSYIAAVMPNSGGVGAPWPGEFEHLPAVMTVHGAPGGDVVLGIDFSVSSATFDQDMAARGAFVVNCDHGGGHCAAPAELVAAQWQFLKDHPFGQTESPYADGLPASFPAYCEIVP